MLAASEYCAKTKPFKPHQSQKRKIPLFAVTFNYRFSEML